jgi:hypothetical protein
MQDWAEYESTKWEWCDQLDVGGGHCGQRFRTFPELQLHEWEVHGGWEDSCAFCSEVFHDRMEYRVHLGGHRKVSGGVL